MLQLVSHGRGKKMRANRFVEGRESERNFHDRIFLFLFTAFDCSRKLSGAAAARSYGKKNKNFPLNFNLLNDA